jgi:hypothetical protein
MARPLGFLGLLFLLSACGKNDTTDGSGSLAPSAAVATSAVAVPSAPSAPAPQSAPAPAKSAADSPPPPKCPPGFTGNGDPAYCIKLPGAYAVKQARITPKRGSIDYDTGTSTDNLTISFDESPISQLSKDVESEMKFGGDKLEKKGNLPGGGKWFQGTHAEYSRIVTLVKGQGSLSLKCSFAYQPKKSPSKDAIDACKSIVVP